MVSIAKTYNNAPVFLLNSLYDIVEMRKATITYEDEDTLTIDTEMYGIKTEYNFHTTASKAGTTITVETAGDDENALRRVRLMIATLDNMLELPGNPAVR